MNSPSNHHRDVETHLSDPCLFHCNVLHQFLNHWAITSVLQECISHTWSRLSSQDCCTRGLHTYQWLACLLPGTKRTWQTKPKEIWRLGRYSSSFIINFYDLSSLYYRIAIHSCNRGFRRNRKRLCS